LFICISYLKRQQQQQSICAHINTAARFCCYVVVVVVVVVVAFNKYNEFFSIPISLRSTTVLVIDLIIIVFLSRTYSFYLVIVFSGIFVFVVHCVSKKTSPTFLAITRESIDGYFIIFGRNITDKASSHMLRYFSTSPN